MVDHGVIGPFCSLLAIRDSQIVQVVLDGLNNILKKSGARTDEVCQKIEECGGLDKIEHLQNHESEEIYKMAYEIIDNYFSSEDEDIVGGQQPSVENPAFVFEPTQQNVPDEGFSFQ